MLRNKWKLILFPEFSICETALLFFKVARLCPLVLLLRIT
jgi:hypothetical protein